MLPGLDEIADFVLGLLTGTRRIGDNFVHLVQRVGDDLAAAGVRLGDEVAEAPGRLTLGGSNLDVRLLLLDT